MEPSGQKPQGRRKRRREYRDSGDGKEEAVADSEAHAEGGPRQVPEGSTANIQIPEGGKALVFLWSVCVVKVLVLTTLASLRLLLTGTSGISALPIQNSNPTLRRHEQSAQSSLLSHNAILQALGPNPLSRLMDLQAAAAAMPVLGGQGRQPYFPWTLGASSYHFQQQRQQPQPNYNIDPRSLLISQLAESASRSNETEMQARLLELAFGLPQLRGQRTQHIPERAMNLHQLGSQLNQFLSSAAFQPPLRAGMFSSQFAGHGQQPVQRPAVAAAARAQPEREASTGEGMENAVASDMDDAPPPTGRAPVPLFLPSDDDTVSPYQCLARQQIEFFEASAAELTAGAQGRNRPITLGQVGIRCKHCANLEHRQKARAHAFYPSKLEGIYQAAQNIANSHLIKHCTLIPSDVREQLVLLQAQKSARGGGKKYWVEAAARCGVYDSEDGIRFSSGH